MSLLTSLLGGNSGGSGGGGSSTTTRVSFSSVASKTVTHNLGYYPVIQVFDSGGYEIVCDISQDSTDQFTISFDDGSSSGYIVYSSTSSGPGVAIYSAVDTKTVTHGLGYYPIIQVFDVTGYSIVCDISQDSLNQFTVSFDDGSSSGYILYI